MTKGADTRRAILYDALNLSSEVGLEGLSIGMLAKKAGMSKSGLYAHFESKEDLQCSVLDAAAQRFTEVVIVPVRGRPRGLLRMQEFFERWIEWETEVLSGGCLFIAAAPEFDDQPGPVRDRLVSHLQDLFGAINRTARICVEEGHFRADLDLDQFAYELWAIFLAYHHFSRLMQEVDSQKRARHSFERILQNAQDPSQI